jgi:hypothetical protein
LANKNFAWRDKLHKRAAHKALNIPEDEVIQANRITGVTWKEIAAAGVVGASLLGAGKYLFDAPKTEAPAAAASSDTDTDTITDFEFVEPAGQ